MKVSEILEKMRDFTDDERVKYLGPLIDGLCSLSQNTLLDFQMNWDGEKGFDAFKEEQADQVELMIKMDMSETGKFVRETENLKPLTLDTEFGV